jgi:hypothetical protein
MRSPSLALSWQTWGRHRWLIGALAAGFAGLIALQRILPHSVQISEFGVFITTIPLGFMFIFVAYAFSHAEIGAGVKASSFPAWMFTLPVRTAVLVAWPMLWAALALSATWVAAAHWVFRAAGLDVPLWWPAFGLAATMAWLQAIDWSPLRLFSKLLAIAVVLGALWASLWTVMMRAAPDDPTRFLVLLFLPAAYGAALVGVSRARHGQHEGGLAWRLSLGGVLGQKVRQRRPFASAAWAQFWLEWRRTGILIPALVGCWLLLLTALIPVQNPEWISNVLGITQVYLLPIFAPLVGIVVGKTEVWSRQFRLTSFASRLPQPSGGLAVAKLQAVAAGLAVAWVLLTLFSLAWMMHVTSERDWSKFWFNWEHAVREMGAAWAYAEIVLFVISLVGITCFQLLGHLFAGLCGRIWVFGATILFYMVGIPNILVVNSWLHESHREVYDAYYNNLTLLAGVAVALKLLAAGWVCSATLRRRLAGSWFIGIIAGCWLLLAGSFFTFLYLTNRPGGTVKESVSVAWLAFVAMLAVPLTRILCTPLAVEWNRRR